MEVIVQRISDLISPPDEETKKKRKMEVIVQRLSDLISPPDEETKKRRKRLEKEVATFHQNRISYPRSDALLCTRNYRMVWPCTTGGPVTGTLFHWRATMKGPHFSPYEGQFFELCIDLPQHYPDRPPKVTFLTAMFHPNIDNKGEVSLHILKENKWNSAYNINAVLHRIYHMLAKPSLDQDDMVSPDIAYMYETDRSKFESIARSRSLTEWEREWD